MRTISQMVICDQCGLTSVQTKIINPRPKGKNRPEIELPAVGEDWTGYEYLGKDYCPKCLEKWVASTNGHRDIGDTVICQIEDESRQLHIGKEYSIYSKPIDRGNQLSVYVSVDHWNETILRPFQYTAK